MSDPCKKRYIVTGAAGHLGSTILRYLSKSGEEAHGLLLPGESASVSDPRFRFFSGDVCDIDSLRCLFENSNSTIIAHKRTDYKKHLCP